jgi:hypothetical protein
LSDLSAELLEITEAFAGEYSGYLGLTIAEMMQFMDGRDHFLTADDALAMGISDMTMRAQLPMVAQFDDSRFVPAAAAAQHQEAIMADENTPAAPESPTDNVVEIKAKAKSDVVAALKVRNDSIKARFDALGRANPGSLDAIRAVYDEVIADVDATVDGFTDRALAALVQQTPVVASHSVRVEAGEDQSEKRSTAIVASVMARAGVTRESTAGNPYRGHTLLDLAKDCLARAGIKTDGMTKLEVVGAAFTQSSSDFPILMENTMNKTLQSSYAIAADTWRRFCAVGSVSDFRAHNRYQIGALGDLVPVNELGEFTNKPIPDGRKQSVIVGTFGDIINLSRQAVINDDLGAFVGLAQARGRAAARTIENKVYAVLGLNSGIGPLLSDGKAIIHTDHGNIATVLGAPSVLTLADMKLKMRAQKDVAGKDFLDLTPTVMLVPDALEDTARILNTAMYDPAATLSTKNPNTPNPYMGAYTDIIGTPRLSGTGWYAFADPSIAPVLEVSFLDGVQEPFLEMEQGFTVDGARWKTRLDFGVSGVGYEGVVRNAGA